MGYGHFQCNENDPLSEDISRWAWEMRTPAILPDVRL
jgi:hypothetical protein